MKLRQHITGWRFLLATLFWLAAGIITITSTGAAGGERSSAPIVADPMSGTSSPTLTPTTLTPTPASCSPRFTLFPSPNPNLFNSLRGVKFGSPNDGWAVGYTSNDPNYLQYSLTLHWDGSNWQVVQSPNPGSLLNELRGVTILPNGHAWAAGRRNIGSGHYTFTLNWDGSTWNHVLSPNPGANLNELYDTIGFADNDVWAVGNYYDSWYKNLALHWDGSNWSQVNMPQLLNQHSFPERLSATGPNDIWAAGFQYNAYNVFSTMVLHWDGAQWNYGANLNAGGEGSALFGVSALSSDYVWVGGYSQESGITRNLVAYGHGNTWTIVPTPSLGSGNNEIQQVLALGPNDVWAAGDYTSPSGASNTLAMHWDGAEWSIVPSDSPGDQSTFQDINIEGNMLWAVGYYTAGSEVRTLVEQFDLSCPLPTNTPTPTNTRTPTPIGTWYTATPTATTVMTATATPCSLCPTATRTSTSTSVGTSTETNTATPTATTATTATATPCPLCPTATSTNTDTPTETNTPSATPTPVCLSGWTIINSPIVGNGPNELHGVAALSPSDVWVVGHSYGDNGYPRTLTEHWDGAGWTVVPSPNMSAGHNYLTAVTAVASDDVWAVGYYLALDDNWRGQVLHWDGTVWSEATIPNVYPYGQQFFGVAASSSSDVWVVGYKDNDSGVEQAYSMHWDGAQWSSVPCPQIQDRVYLQSVSILSPNDVWAVGYHGGIAWYTVTMHWDGSSWSIVSSPNAGSDPNFLYSVLAIAPNDVWAAGTGSGQRLMEHWNGQSWSIFSHPTAGTFYGLAATAPNDVWGVGTYYAGTFAEHWDGASWHAVQSPNQNGNGTLRAISALGPNDLWAVGDYVAGGQAQSLVEHYTGSCGPPTSTATPTVAQPTPTCVIGWGVQTVPQVGQSSTLRAVSALSHSDTWAVGEQDNDALTLAMHWNGASWQHTTTVDPGYGMSHLYGVVAIAPNDVWAVGGDNAGYPQQNLIEHWDGVQWTLSGSPHMGNYDILLGVGASASNDVWAVGYTVNSTSAVHWDGAGWSVVATANVGVRSVLQRVAVSAPNDAWAVGYYQPAGGIDHPLIEHWDGAQWAQIASPSVGSSDNVLNDVAIISPNDVWAVGYYLDNGVGHTLALHWDGSAWAVEDTPDLGGAFFAGVSIVSGRPWAVGARSTPSGDLTLVEEWLGPGQGWQLVYSPNPGAANNNLSGITALPSGEVWAVGSRSDAQNGAVQSLVEHYDPGCGVPSPTPTSTVTGTPPTATSTPTQGPTDTPTSTPTWSNGNATPSLTPTPTPTSSASSPTATVPITATAVPPTGTTTPDASATPIACTIQFSDVPVGSTFYPYVHCLACLGIINGYQDGSFKPNNHVTRGQLSKIVSNAANFTDDVTGRWTYTDVPSTQTFWQLIERLSLHQVMSGYQCGGPGEPCDGQNRPYFRPGSNATRGQISKIVSNARGYNDTTTGQTYADVPSANSFYTFIERLTLHGVISGYLCGGPGEPCDPQRRPYFRPGNDATRGQVSKIVSNTFYPNCSTPARR